MWDDSIIKYPGAPFQARRRYGARRIIRKNCAYRGKLRDNPQIARSSAIHRAAAVLRASRGGRCPSIARLFCETPKSGSRKSWEAQARKRRGGSAVRIRSRTENQARGNAVLFAMPRALPRFFPDFFAKRRKAVHGNPGSANPEAPARLCRENTGKDGKSGAGDAVLFAMPRALPPFLPLTFLRSAEERFTEIRGSANPEAPGRFCRENTVKDGKSGAGQCGSFCIAAFPLNFSVENPDAS